MTRRMRLASPASVSGAVGTGDESRGRGPDGEAESSVALDGSRATTGAGVQAARPQNRMVGEDSLLDGRVPPGGEGEEQARLTGWPPALPRESPGLHQEISGKLC